MHRYDELEKMYYRNKIKKYTFITISVLFLAAGTYFGIDYLSKPKQNKTPEIKVDFKKITNTKPDNGLKDKNITVNEKKAVVKTENKKPVETTVKKNNTEKKHQKIVKKQANSESLTPNLSFVVPKIKPNDINAAKEPVQKLQKTQVVKKETPKKKDKVTTVSNNIQVIPQIKEETINIKDLIKAFNKEPSYDTAIVISNYYYNKNDLANAKLWALKANNIDPSKYQSWKMFALILLKKNDKIKAKEVLKIYLNDYGNNDEIYKLLRSIDE